MKSLLRKLAIVLILQLAILIPFRNAFPETEPSGDDVDSAAPVYPEKRKSRGIGETLVSLPGRLVSVPFDLILTGTGAVTGWIEENRIPQRLRDLTTFKGGKLGVRFKYSSDDGIGPDFFLKDLLNVGSRIHLSSTMGLRGRQSFRLTMSRLKLGSEKISTRISGGYLKYTDEAFFGLGPGSREDERMDYLFESAYFATDAVFRPVRGIEFSLGAGIENNSARDGLDSNYPGLSYTYGPGELGGMTGGLTLASVRAGYRFSNLRSSNVGTLVSISGNISSEIEGDEYGFARLDAEFIQKLPLIYGRYFQLRFVTSMVEPTGGRQIPFYSLSEIGRRETMRGYPRARFRDRDMLVGSLEYHFPVWEHSTNRVETFLFSDAGQVAGDIRSGVEMDQIKISYGGGLILFGAEGESMRASIGISEEGYRLYFNWN